MSGPLDDGKMEDCSGMVLHFEPTADNPFTQSAVDLSFGVACTATMPPIYNLAYTVTGSSTVTGESLLPFRNNGGAWGIDAGELPGGIIDLGQLNPIPFDAALRIEGNIPSNCGSNGYCW
jgi:hypothetical protein